MGAQAAGQGNTSRIWAQHLRPFVVSVRGARILLKWVLIPVLRVSRVKLESMGKWKEQVRECTVLIVMLANFQPLRQPLPKLHAQPANLEHIPPLWVLRLKALAANVL